MGGIQQPGYAKGTFKRHYFNKSYFSLHCPFLRGSFAHLGLAQSQNARTAVYVCVFVCVCVCVYGYFRVPLVVLYLRSHVCEIMKDGKTRMSMERERRDGGRNQKRGIGRNRNKQRDETA